MGLSFQEKLRNYARLALIHGLGYGQKVRPLFIDSYQTEDHGHFIPMLAEEAYAMGVETVDVRYRYPELERAMFRGAPESYKAHEPDWVSVRAMDIVTRDGARIALNGNGSLGVMEDVDPKYPSAFRSAYFKSNEPYTSRRMKMLQPWTIFDVPTVAWAKKLGISIDDLWDFLFSITGADQEDHMAFAKANDKAIHKRCRLMNELGIRTLHFMGEGTDLFVGLSKKARWIGGSKAAEDGTMFEANWPSFEVYTTPDWRTVEGVVRVTIPSVINGPIVDRLEIGFVKGRVSDFDAGENGNVFKALITEDTGAAQLGEIACVGLDSPLSRYAEPHFCGLLDENKRCHMAFGQAYAAALEGGASATPEELAELGCNDSHVHHDMMISDETTSIFALDENGIRIAQLMRDGRWLEELL